MDVKLPVLALLDSDTTPLHVVMLRKWFSILCAELSTDLMLFITGLWTKDPIGAITIKGIKHVKIRPLSDDDLMV